ncbi:MAG TPA: hypothetical protein VN936_02865 [Candidatus Acidoferrum sp.]|nr:hypothetical protein [Candidatus Acidoferrum sp.]
MNDPMVVYPLTVAIALILGSRIYIAILVVLFRLQGRKPMFTRREAVYLGIAFFCVSSIMAAAIAYQTTSMMQLSLAFGAGAMAGAGFYHCWLFRAAFAKRVR